MAPVLGSLQQIPALQDNLIAIEPWHLNDMSVMERQRRETNKYTPEHQYDNDVVRTTKSLGKRGILEEEELEWYIEDLLDSYIASHLVKRGNIKDKAKDAADGAKDAVDNAGDKVKDFVDDAKSGFKETADKAKDHAGKVEDKAKDASEHGKDGGSDLGDALKDAKDAIRDTVKKVKDDLSR